MDTAAAVAVVTTNLMTTCGNSVGLGVVALVLDVVQDVGGFLSVTETHLAARVVKGNRHGYQDLHQGMRSRGCHAHMRGHDNHGDY